MNKWSGGSFILLIFILSNQIFAQSVFDFKKLPSENTLIKEYHSKLSQMSENVCQAGSSEKYDKLLSSYRQEGFYVPFLLDESIDTQAISDNISLVRLKVEWIKKEISKLEKSKWPSYSLISKPIEKRISKLLDIKKKHRFSKNKKSKERYYLESEAELKKLNADLGVFFGKVNFLLNPYFPVSHQKNREEFDRYKKLDGEESKKNANAVFFKRKIYEDGTYDRNHARSDVFLRTTLDTLALNLLNEKGLLSENTRSDIEWILRNTKIVLKRGKSDQLARLNDWQKRSQEALSFYENLVKPKSDLLKKVADTRLENTDELKGFVLNKLKNVYAFWLKQDEVYRSLYISDLILMHEVGRPLRSNELDRKDIAQIILNRRESQKYSRIVASDALFPFLSKLFSVKKNQQLSPWLDVLFKEGEFSFTYYFIPSVKNVFCPELSKYAQGMRENNLKLALSQMKEPDWDFRALRYFSRVSMTGKVDMAPIWANEYESLPERPGREVTLKKKDGKKFTQGRYDYLYSFQSEKGMNYDVIRIQDNIYTVFNLEKKPQFFEYRDPQFFTYFSARVVTASR